MGAIRVWLQAAWASLRVRRRERGRRRLPSRLDRGLPAAATDIGPCVGEGRSTRGHATPCVKLPAGARPQEPGGGTLPVEGGRRIPWACPRRRPARASTRPAGDYRRPGPDLDRRSCRGAGNVQKTVACRTLPPSRTLSPISSDFCMAAADAIPRREPSNHLA